MKQLQLILFFTLVFQCILFAQHPVWPQPDAEWEMCSVSYPGFQETYNTTPPIRYEKDTVINNINYQISRKFQTNGGLYIEFITRFEQDTIFRFLNGSEYMFFTYDVAVDDTLFPLRTGIEDYNEDTCSYTLELLCLDIYSVNVDGNSLDLYEFVDVGNSIYGLNGASGQTTKYYWIEIIGWVNSFPWLIVPSEYSCNQMVFDGGQEFPIHYSDSTRSWSIEFPENGLVCDTLLSLPSNEIIEFLIIPNPNNGTFKLQNLTSEEISDIKVYSLDGRIIQFEQWKEGNKTHLSLENTEKGVYYIQITTENNKRFVEKFVIN